MGDGTILVGIDCATQVANTGVAWGELRDDGLWLRNACAATDPPSEQLAAWVGSKPEVVIALDAPLGWPRELGRRLMGHLAGEVILAPADRMFRRHTDEFITQKLGKRPLEVGADRIARTALAALNLVDALRHRTGREIPLGWTPGVPAQAVAIEVYPAAVLTSLDLPSSRYKGNGEASRVRRRQIVTALAALMGFDEELACAMCERDHVLDAALCVLAAAHFVRGEVWQPTDARLSQREGWIWARPADAVSADAEPDDR